MDADAAALLRSASLFRGVSDLDVQAVLARFDTVSIAAGAAVFRQGESGEHLYVVLSGKVKLARSVSDGRENLVAVMGPADEFGELSLFDPGPRTVTATAVTDAVLARLAKAALREWLRSRPQVALQLLQVLARRLRRTDTMVADLIFVDVAGRIARQLLDLADRFGHVGREGLRVQHDLTQEELAHLVGSSRETVNRALAEFASRGWLRLDGKSVIILDRDRLTRRIR